MSFSDPIVGGPNGILKRNAIQSQNFITTVSGWRIARDGTAEFLQALIRGTLIVSGADGSYIKIDKDNLNNPFIAIYPADPGNLGFQPAFIKLDAITSQTILTLTPAWISPTGDFGEIEIFGGDVGDSTGVRITGEMSNALDAMTYARGIDGTVSITALNGQPAANLAVTFPFAFPLGTTPRVYTNMTTSSGTAAQWVSKAMGPTNTGFTLRILGPATTGFTTNVDYFAFAPIN